MKKSRKQDARKPVSAHLTTLHQRLYQSLSLGFRYSENNGREWYTNDVEMQRLVIRSVAAFLADISSETFQIPLVKDSVADMVMATGSILRSSNVAVVTMASEIVVKLIDILPRPMLQLHAGYLFFPLSSLLSSHQSNIAIKSATALNLILSKLSLKKRDEMWQIFEKHNVVAQVICNFQVFLEKDKPINYVVKPIEYFVEMTSLLSYVMQIWPRTRYHVWADTNLTKVMEHFCCTTEPSVRVALLELYSAIALCRYGAQKLMENGKLLVNFILQSMGKSQPLSIRILAFKAAQQLMDYEDLCLEGLSFSCKPLVKSIISAMSCSIHDGKVPNEVVSLIMEACRLALISRWPGKHHGYLWKFGAHRSLLHILMPNALNVHPHHQSWSVDELISVTREGLNANFLLNLRAYVWEILGSLSAQCEEDFNPNKDGTDFHFRVLITSACLSFVDSISRERLVRRENREYTLRSLSAAKAVLMMVYSPCKYIAFHARLILTAVLRLESVDLSKHLLSEFECVDSNVTSMSDEVQMLISLMGLTCFSGLPQVYRFIVRNDGVKALLDFVWWWFRNEAHIGSVSSSSHLRYPNKVQMCCRMDKENWEGREIHLLLALWSLAELINCHEAEGRPINIFEHHTTYKRESFIHDIQDICVRTRSSGLRWYSSYLLSLFDIFGFPCKLGKKNLALFCENDLGDLCLVLRDGQSISVHNVVLLIRCPSFLRPEDPVIEDIANSFQEYQFTDTVYKTKKEVTLSAHVDEQALRKVMEFVYSGCLHAGGRLVRKVEVLAEHYNIKPLLQLLGKKRPKWEASVPNFDLTTALGPDGREFSDVILEAKSTEDNGWICNCCSCSVPHIHAHKAILMSSVNYLRAIFQSGMQESRSQNIKVPVTWEALHILAIWVYSGDMPKSFSGCIWDNMDVDRKMLELRPYIELCWLSEFWFIDDLGNECSAIVTSQLDSPDLSLKLIQFAVNLSQWDIVTVAANRIAPIYGHLRISGGLDILDEGIVEIIRQASIRLSQE